MHIVKQLNGRYRDTKTGEWIPVSKLTSKCPVSPVNAELKHENIIDKRWDLNY